MQPPTMCIHWTERLKKCSASICQFQENGECTVGGDMSKLKKRRPEREESYESKGEYYAED